MALSISNYKKIYNAGGEVQRYMGFAVYDRDAVSVSIAGPWHAPTEDEEWRAGEKQAQEKLTTKTNTQI